MTPAVIHADGTIDAAPTGQTQVDWRENVPINPPSLDGMDWAGRASSMLGAIEIAGPSGAVVRSLPDSPWFDAYRPAYRCPR